MEYNKIKRGLEKAAGIVGVVLSSLQCLDACESLISALYLNSADVYFIVSHACFIAITILSIVFCAKVISTPLKKDGTVVARNPIRICVIVFSFLSGVIVSAGLMISVLCLKDFVEPEEDDEESKQKDKENNDTNEKAVESKILELKKLKELEVIDEETYKKALQKLIDKI